MLDGSNTAFKLEGMGHFQHKDTPVIGIVFDTKKTEND